MTISTKGHACRANSQLWFLHVITTQHHRNKTTFTQSSLSELYCMVAVSLSEEHLEPVAATTVTPLRDEVINERCSMAKVLHIFVHFLAVLWTNKRVKTLIHDCEFSLSDYLNLAAPLQVQLLHSLDTFRQVEPVETKKDHVRIRIFQMTLSSVLPTCGCLRSVKLTRHSVVKILREETA